MPLNDLDAKRIKILEERVSALEQKTNNISAPILDAIESFRRDTLSLFEGFAGRLEKRMDETEARLSARFDAVDKRFDEVLAAIKKDRP